MLSLVRLKQVHASTMTLHGSWVQAFQLHALFLLRECDILTVCPGALLFETEIKISAPTVAESNCYILPTSAIYNHNKIRCGVC